MAMHRKSIRPEAFGATLKAKGDRLAVAGQWREAGKLYRQVTETQVRDVEAWVKLGITERQLGAFARAEACHRRAISLQPRLPIAHIELGAALQAQGKIDEALARYDQAIALQPGFADAHYLKGNALHERSSMEAAIESYRKAIALSPLNGDAYGGLGAVLLALDRRSEAEEALRRSLNLKPNAPTALTNLAILCERHGQIDEAITLYRRALQIAPASAPVSATYAALLERIGRLDEARQVIASVPGPPGDPALCLVQARLARREGQTEEALAILNKAALSPDLALAGEINIMRGQLHDQLGQSMEALASLALGNRQVATLAGVPLDQPPKYLASIAVARRYLTPELATMTPAPGDQETPVFLIGFPRSGTTLLDKILDSHPQIQTLEEKPAVAAMRELLFDMGETATLHDLDSTTIAALKEAYFRVVDSSLTRLPGAILVDKLPLNTLWAHLVWRVFPNAKFILALRHPCDVCLSCFMQNFGLNTAMESFLTLEHTVQIYAATMAFWEEQCAALPLQYHPVHYERLVENLEAEVQPLLHFLGVPWNADMARFAEHARRKDRIATPSYHQVTQPLYRHAAFRWRRYAGAFTPHMDVLRPFITSFGYEDPPQ